MHLGPINEDDPALPTLRKYIAERDKVEWHDHVLAILLGTKEERLEDGVEITIHHRGERRYVTRVEYVGTTPQDKVIPLPVGDKRPSPPPTVQESPIWNHLGHVLVVIHTWIGEVPHETATLYCRTCNRSVINEIRKRKTSDQPEDPMARDPAS